MLFAPHAQIAAHKFHKQTTLEKMSMNRRITVAGYGIIFVCTLFGASVQSAQPIQVLTLDQLDQPDKAASSSVAPRAIRHHRHVRRDVLVDASKPAARPVDARKGESGDVIAAFAGDASAIGRSAPSRRGKSEASSSGVGAGFYRVNSGDTLTRIATAFGQQPKDLRDWNSLTANSLIQPGQVLRVGPPAAWRAERGR